MSTYKLPSVLIYRLVTGNPCWAKVGKQHCPVWLDHFTSDYLYNWAEWKQKPLSTVSERPHEGSQEGRTSFLELECPSPHWKNQDLVSSGIEETRRFMRYSAQCLTSAGYQLYNAVALFVISLLYSKCHRSTHTRCLRGCVAYKTGTMLTRLTRGKGLSRPYPETHM